MMRRTAVGRMGGRWGRSAETVMWGLAEQRRQRREGGRERERATAREGKREATTELEVTEYVANERVRMVADQGGTIWDTLFVTKAVEDGSIELTMEMEARAYKLFAKLMNPLIRGMVQGAIERDMTPSSSTANHER